MKQFVALLSLLIITYSCREPIQNVSPPDDLTETEYTILHTIVDTLGICDNEATIHLYDSTRIPLISQEDFDRTLNYVQENIPELRTDTREDFMIRNTTRSKIYFPKRICPKCVGVATVDTYPSLEVSRVGFASDSSQAMAYIGFVAAPLVGEALIVVMRRNYNNWSFVGSCLLWISKK